MLVTAVIGLQASTLVEANGRHPVCAARQHDCGGTARIARCCCGGNSQSTNPPAPVQTQVQVGPDVSVAVVALPPAPLPAADSLCTAGIDQSPPHRATIDIPTLFASLLI